MISSTLIYTIVAFAAIMIIIYKMKPKFLFHDGELKQFGVGKDKIPIPFSVMAIIAAICIYFFFSYITGSLKSSTSIDMKDIDINTLLSEYNRSEYNRSEYNRSARSEYAPRSRSRYHQPKSEKPFTYRVIKTTADGRIIQ
jgi:hypothetical protein